MTSTSQPDVGPKTGDIKHEIAGAAAKIDAQARDTISDAVGSATREAQSQAMAAKTDMAGEVSDIAAALRVAADEMRSGSVQARVFAQMAESLADASDTIEQKDLSGIMDGATDFARRNPLIFLGGAALLGFAATRFAKASGDRSTSSPAPVHAPMHANDGFAAQPAPSAPYAEPKAQVYGGTGI